MSDWIKLYNSLRSHPKIVRAGDRAAWLYVCGLCFSNEHLTDGFIAEDVLVVAAPGVKQPERLAGALVNVGLWHVVEGGWQIHDYADVQRTASQIREQREKDRKRKAKAESARNPAGHHADSGRLPRTEESREEKNPPSPPGEGSIIKFDRKPVPPERLALAERLLADFNAEASTGYGAFTGDGKASEGLKRIIGALTHRPDVTEAWARRAVAWQLARPYWDGPAQPGVVYGPGNWDKALEATKTIETDAARSERFRSLQGRIA